MQVRLFVDEDAMADALMTGLRARGVNLLTASEAGTRKLEDEEQLASSAAQGRVLYTFNISDFYRLHTTRTTHGKSHAGIIFAPQQRYSVGEQMRRLLKLIRLRSAEEMIDNVEFLSHWS